MIKQLFLASAVLLGTTCTAFAADPIDDSLTVTVTPQQSSGAPRGATRVPFLNLTFSASCDEDVTLNSVEVKHGGLGNSDDLSSVYVFSSSRRVSRAVQFDTNSQRATIRFLRGIVIPKCDVVTMQLFADISRDADPSGEHTISIPSATSIQSSAAHVNLQASEPSVVVTKPKVEGSIEVRMLPADKRPRYGSRARVARIQLSSDNQSAHKIESITLTNRGSARSLDLQQIYLENSRGEQISNIISKMDEKYITFRFDPRFVLPRSTTVIWNVRGMVRGSITKTFQFTVEEASDITAEAVKRL